MNFLYAIIALGTILGGTYAVVSYLASIKRKVDTDEFNSFMAEQRMAWQNIENKLELIRIQVNSKINAEELYELKTSILRLTSEVETLKHGK